MALSARTVYGAGHCSAGRFTVGAVGALTTAPPR
eukprot:CAMPEP_0114570840 /NCGR_PEP_ID=MMETSP0114-20121206/17421_1 /TAXON_ID=31324 /ORGANISM="Goniomonas sp, Strain m" /LENGTH=33 /DNA_ID= /DNA_START= /DNA_END= /DNA_ORIENTATION=